MAKLCGVVLLLICSIGLGADASVKTLLSADAEAAKNRPVTKVINLLKQMLKELEAEAEADEEIYDKLACWCETNDKEKTKISIDAKVSIERLKRKIDEYSELSVNLALEIKTLESQMYTLNESLSKASAIRMKELEEFNEDEKNLISSIKSLKDAIIVLKKHSTLVQLDEAAQTDMLSVASKLEHVMQQHADILGGVLSPSQRREVAAFVQDGPRGFKSYNPASGEILGVLEQMKETFEKDLSAKQKAELEASQAYEQLKASIETELAASKKLWERKVQELANVGIKLADSKEDLMNIEVTLEITIKSLGGLKEKCAKIDAEYEARVAERNAEIEAITKALSFLTSDDAHDLFTKTFNAALLQREAANQKTLRTKVSELLNKVAKQNDSPRLAALAYQIRLDAFTKVKQAIDDMIAELTKEQADEVKHKDFCIDELNTNQLQTEKQERAKVELEATIEDLKAEIATLTKEIKELKAEIAESQLQMKRAGEDREIENKDFQLIVADQRATIKLLTGALHALKSYYGFVQASISPSGKGGDIPEGTSKASVSIKVTVETTGGPKTPMPPGFGEQTKNAMGNPVINLIEQVIADAKKMMAEAIRDEEDAQTAYEDFVKDSNAEIDSKTKEIISKSAAKSKAETELAASEDALDAVEADLAHLSDYATQLHSSCDFVLKNFDIRQKARSEEIAALKQAKAILSGAKFDALLQSYGA